MEATLGKIPATDPARTHPMVPGLRLPTFLKNPHEGEFRAFCETNRAVGDASGNVVMLGPQESAKGRTLALCGAGPSLAGQSITGVDDVWACNSALTYLLDHGVRVTAALGIDQTMGLVREWTSAPDVPYYIASSVNPALVTHLRERGRTLRWFHNAVGFADEIEYYKTAWPKPACVMAHGATVVPRAIGLAFWLGYERVDVYGADCAFAVSVSGGDVAHANGESADAAYNRPDISSGIVNGRVWRSRPDMLLSAVDLARLVRGAAGRVRLIGDTLPVALLGKDDGFLDQVIRRLSPDEPSPDATVVSYTFPAHQPDHPLE